MVAKKTRDRGFRRFTPCDRHDQLLKIGRIGNEPEVVEGKKEIPEAWTLFRQSLQCRPELFVAVRQCLLELVAALLVLCRHND